MRIRKAFKEIFDYLKYEKREEEKDSKRIVDRNDIRTRYKSGTKFKAKPGALVKKGIGKPETGKFRKCT